MNYTEGRDFMEKRYKDLIFDEFKNCVNNTIQRLHDNAVTYRPFHTALLSKEAIFWSQFERSFSTSFGQRTIEEIVHIVALANGAEDTKRQKETYVHIDSGLNAAINAHIQALRTGHHYNWDTTLKDILSASKTGSIIELRIISDFWWLKNGINNYISIKTVKPNIDQTSIAKEDCLRLTINDPTCRAYFGLPYNPYGENKLDYAFNPPMGIFDFHNDKVVLIGKDMWDTIGGEGCYGELLEIAEQVGKETRPTISKLIKP